VDRNELWSTLIQEATRLAPCVEDHSTCWLNFRWTPWYAQFVHGDYAPHTCGVCNPAIPPTRIVSVDSLLTTKREVLVARLALWLTHAHESPTNLGADGRTGDRDLAGTPAPAIGASVADLTAADASAADAGC
jgi:hypothetical protein